MSASLRAVGRSTTMMGVALAMAGMGFLPTSGAAQQQVGSPRACYVPGSGTVYLIQESKTPSTCRMGHLEFNMASLGSAGPQLAGGKGGGAGLPTNAQGAFDFSNDNGLLSIGTPGSGNLPATGAGTRLMWYPGKAALRAGSVTGAQWDDSNIGSSSVALGLNAIASGLGSVAMGHSTIAIGDVSVAMGASTLASAYGSTALGSGSSATGVYSFAAGLGATAVGFSSIALGQAVTATGAGSVALGKNASTDSKSGAFVYGDRSSATNISATADNQFIVRAQRFWLGTNNAVTATANRFLETSTGAYLSTGGVWVSSSDSARKHQWQDVDGETVLEKLAGVPVLTWSYRNEDTTVRHMGPTAQEFHAAFGLGDTDKGIGTVDADGVALAGIKALAKRTADLRRENEALKTALAEMSRRLADLEAVRQ